MTTNKGNHGGRRSNQTGRPRMLKADRRPMVSFRLAPELVAWLKRQPNQTRAIEEALIQHYGLAPEGNENTPASAGAVAESKGD